MRSAHQKNKTQYSEPKTNYDIETENIAVNSFNARVCLQRTNDLASERDDRKRMQNVCLLVSPSNNKVYQAFLEE